MIEKNILSQWDKEYIWHPFTQMQDWIAEENLIIEKGQGSYLYDVEGNKYIDGVSSLWVNVHGHNHPELNKALDNQIKNIAHSTLLGLSNVPATRLAKELAAVTPEGLSKVFYSDNGSTAVEIALKMAYQACQQEGHVKKKYFISFENAYHGDTIGSVSVGGMDLFHKMYQPFLFDVLRCPAPYCFRCPFGMSQGSCSTHCLSKVKELLGTRSDEIVGVIVEPMIQGAAGMLTQPHGFLSELRSLTREHDVFLITDEVATGFGRTGKMFACEHEEVAPDFMTLAKGITGGYLPLAATLTTQRVFDAFYDEYATKKTFFHGHTYTGNPLGCALALRNLELFEEEKTLDRLQGKISSLEDCLQRFYELDYVGDIRLCGFMAGIELVRDKETLEPFLWEEKIGIKVIQEARKQGVIIRPLGNVVVLMPPLSISLEELDDLLRVVYESIKTVTDSI